MERPQRQSTLRAPPSRTEQFRRLAVCRRSDCGINRAIWRSVKKFNTAAKWQHTGVKNQFFQPLVLQDNLNTYRHIRRAQTSRSSTPLQKGNAHTTHSPFIVYCQKPLAKTLSNAREKTLTTPNKLPSSGISANPNRSHRFAAAGPTHYSMVSIWQGKNCPILLSFFLPSCCP